jgi:hypothetical protein
MAAIILGATLTKEELKQMITHLEKMLDKGYFISIQDEPLMLHTSHHLSTNFFGYNFSGLKTMGEILDRVEQLIKTTGKVGDPGMQFLAKGIERSPEWNIKFKGMDPDAAKHKAHMALEFLNELTYKIPAGDSKRPHVTPEELKNMQQHGII